MGNETYPRELTPLERDLLTWILPEDRAGYSAYRELVQRWKVIARGRRGEGNYILGLPDVRADLESPLPQVLAYGIVETRTGNISVSLRERLDNQVEFELVNLQGPEVPSLLEEVRRWTYSSWLSGEHCPICQQQPREVPMQTKEGHQLTLALCPRDERIWVYDSQDGINHPIPITNFYNELMLHQNIRDPKIALDAKRLFRELRQFSDADLQAAFASYNKIRMKVNIESAILVEEPKRMSLVRRLVDALRTRS